MPSNGDTQRLFTVGTQQIRGLGSFHKTLPHNQYGEVDAAAFDALVAATGVNGGGGTADFQAVPPPGDPAKPDFNTFTNPRAGLAKDHLTADPDTFTMPPAPTVTSNTTAAEMAELYWMALCRDVPFDRFGTNNLIGLAATDLTSSFNQALQNDPAADRFILGVDVPGPGNQFSGFTRQNVFRMGLPGEEVGPLLSQFWLRPIAFGTQIIDQQQLPYTTKKNYLTDAKDWLKAQNTGTGADGVDYRKSNESKKQYYENSGDLRRYISSMRDLARFVNKDALHQAYFNAALLLLNGRARWTPGNPYSDKHKQTLFPREAGFGTLGGPHILALVSEVATRALKIVWFQKWQTHLRLRPEAYGGLVHGKKIGFGGTTRPYPIASWITNAGVVDRIRALNNTLSEDDTVLLPMAFTAGSPVHPAYGAGHATVAGACVTVLKAYFELFTRKANGSIDEPLPITALVEQEAPFKPAKEFATYVTGIGPNGEGRRQKKSFPGMTIEGELNKMASNVAMGRTMGGVHWRTDNTRSLLLGEAMAAQILADITTDLSERPRFEFRTFSRKANGRPKVVVIENGTVTVDGTPVPEPFSSL